MESEQPPRGIALYTLLLKLWDVSTGQNNFWAGPNNGIFQLTDYKVNRKAEILIVL